MRRRSRARVAVAVVAALLVAGACSDDDSAGSGEPTQPARFETLRVPEDHATIQAAVDAAQPGDLVLVSPGVYEESVAVRTDELTIRGLDRNEVILDGGFELEHGLRIEADGVAVENMTARNYLYNGFFWTGVTGYRGSYLTAYRNGDYGIYAFGSVDGLFEHSYASGAPDAGFYIGECFPCNAVIDDVVAEWNGLGYSGTNAGGDLYIVRSLWRHNRAGIVPNSGSYERCYPQRDSVIAGNAVINNDNQETPAIDAARLANANGILVTGGRDNVIVRNLVVGHDKLGIGLVPYPEESPVDEIPETLEPCADTLDDPLPDPITLPDTLLWDSEGNSVRQNVVRDSGLADLAFGTLTADAGSLGNCFAVNTFTSSAPVEIEQAMTCEGEPTAAPPPFDVLVLVAEEAPASGDYATTPVPDAQENMPRAATAPPRPATDVPPSIDVDAIRAPDLPADR